MIAYYCVEDQLSKAVILRLLRDLIEKIDLIELQPNHGGFSSIKKKFSNYCKLARHEFVFILTDLDGAECPPSLRKDWIDSARLNEPLPTKMSFNIAVKEVEAWLIADHNNLSNFLGVPKEAFPDDRKLDAPKEYLLNCVRQHGNREAKAQLLPRGVAKVGLGYNIHSSRFATQQWNFIGAAKRSASLDRAVTRIKAARETGCEN